MFTSELLGIIMQLLERVMLCTRVVCEVSGLNVKINNNILFMNVPTVYISIVIIIIILKTIFFIHYSTTLHCMDFVKKKKKTTIKLNYLRHKYSFKL